MEKEEFKIYFNHILGLTLFNVWCKKHQVTIKNNVVNIPIQKSHLFKIGLPIFDKHIYLAAERDEINWLKRLVFNRLIVDTASKKLVLITQALEGDKENLPDVTEIAITIPYVSEKKVEFFLNEKRCCLKEFYIEEGEVVVSKDILFRIPVVVLDEKVDKYFNRNEQLRYTTLEDLISGNIARTNVFKANYQGDEVKRFADPSLNRLLKKFDIKDYEGAFEKGTFISNPNLNEFAQKEYDYDADWIKERDQANSAKIKSDQKEAEKLMNQWG